MAKPPTPLDRLVEALRPAEVVPQPRYPEVASSLGATEPAAMTPGRLGSLFGLKPYSSTSFRRSSSAAFFALRLRQNHNAARTIKATETTGTTTATAIVPPDDKPLPLLAFDAARAAPESVALAAAELAEVPVLEVRESVCVLVMTTMVCELFASVEVEVESGGEVVLGSLGTVCRVVDVEEEDDVEVVGGGGGADVVVDVLEVDVDEVVEVVEDEVLVVDGTGGMLVTGEVVAGWAGAVVVTGAGAAVVVGDSFGTGAADEVVSALMEPPGDDMMMGIVELATVTRNGGSTVDGFENGQRIDDGHSSRAKKGR